MKHTVEPSEDIGALVEQGKELACNLRDQAVAGVKTADKAIRKHPYKAMGIAVGVGAVIGFLLSRRSSEES
jgi:ElaB/YqjD/DUF883 family membrane-anchored ribosome-binding protein